MKFNDRLRCVGGGTFEPTPMPWLRLAVATHNACELTGRDPVPGSRGHGVTAGGSLRGRSRSDAFASSRACDRILGQCRAKPHPWINHPSGHVRVTSVTFTLVMLEIDRRSLVGRLPANPAFQPVLDRGSELARAGGGPFTVIGASPRDEASTAMIRDPFDAARVDEWAKFDADCGKFEAEIDRETAKRELTFGELEEDESLDGYAEKVHHVMRVTTPAIDMPSADQASTVVPVVTNGTIR